MNSRKQVLAGVVLSFIAGVCLSTGGIAIRLVESADGFQILFYRALTLFIGMGLFLLWQHGRRLAAAVVAIGWPGALVSLALGSGAICYVIAVLHTSVANTVVILSTSPLLTAGLGWLLFRQRADRKTLLASAAALSGVSIMVVDGLDSGGLTGMFIAFIAAGSYAVMLIIMQRHRGRDLLPATALSGLVTMAVAWLAVDSLQIGGHDLAISIFLGSFQFGLGFALITVAARYIDAPTVALLTLSEVILAPLWVWIGVDETPTPLGLLGASVVFAAVLAQALSARGLK
ncbi:MAG: EamA family transporter [Gammaproteobacteria bacterium]|nr:EamA family transporter [Gammaproteobacteria bacterium]